MAGAVLLLAGAVLQITRWELAPYLYTLGAVMFGSVQVMGNNNTGQLFFRTRTTRNKCRPRSPIFHKISLYKRGQEMTLVS